MYDDGKVRIEEADLCDSCQFQSDCAFMQALFFGVASLNGIFNLTDCRFYEMKPVRHLKIVSPD